MIQEFHFWVLAEENENITSKRHMHCSIIDNSQYNGNNLSEWIKKWIQWNITQVLKNEWNLAIVTTLMGLGGIMLNEVSHPEINIL